jgi:hypothetical protein
VGGSSPGGDEAPGIRWHLMGWILSNWVERRAAREQNLRNAADVWRKAQATIVEACDSLREYYADIATVTRTQQNGSVVRILIARTPAPALRAEKTTRASLVSVEFHPDKPSIVVNHDHGKALEFPIEADSDHAFLTLQGDEILLDEFSRFALEEVFFGQEEMPARKMRLVR